MQPTETPQILLVDDEPDVLDSLERTLRKRFEILKASSLNQAEEVMRSHPEITVIISDYFLQDGKGVDLLTRSKGILPLASRVLLSGQIDIKAIEQAINDTHIDKFILKPWENDQLLLHIVEAHRLHRRLVEQERLKRLAITDPITQLTNHRFFQEKIRLEWEKHQTHSTPLSLIMIDIDHFKKFNDRFGHPEGDKFLMQVAQTLQEHVPPFASLSRYGGEEFAVILPKTHSPQALTIAEKLRTSILEVSFRDYPLSISLGVATAPEHASSVDELILSADQSLYQAKRRGRNQTVVGLNFDH